VTVAVSCASDGGKSTVRASSPATWAGVSDVPLGGRGSPVIELVAGKLIVFGGVADHDGVRTPLNDGAMLDPETGKWDEIPSPTGEPLAAPAAAAVGGDLVLFGMPCSNRAARGDSLLDCSPGGYRVDRFDAQTRQWSHVSLPQELRGQVGDQPTPRAVGATATTAVFTIDPRDQSPTQFYALQSADWTWRRLPRAPFPVTASCETPTGRIAAVSYVDVARAHTADVGAAAPSQGRPRQPSNALDGAVSPTASSAWGPPANRPVAAPATLLNAFCAGEHIVAVPVRRAEADGGGSFNSTDGHWTPLAPPPADTSANPVSVWTGAELLLFSRSDLDPAASDVSVVGYKPATNGWQLHSSAAGKAVQDAVWVGDRVVISRGIDERGRLALDTYVP
jgi:hypothetical protein